MTRRRKLVFGISLLLVLAVAGVITPLLIRSTAAYTIQKYGVSVCTDDIPSSNCSGYEITVRDTAGKTHILTVEGYTNAKGQERYDALGSVITSAVHTKQQVRLTIVHNVIHAAQLVE